MFITENLEESRKIFQFCNPEITKFVYFQKHLQYWPHFFTGPDLRGEIHVKFLKQDYRTLEVSLSNFFPLGQEKAKQTRYCAIMNILYNDSYLFFRAHLHVFTIPLKPVISSLLIPYISHIALLKFYILAIHALFLPAILPSALSLALSPRTGGF